MKSFTLSLAVTFFAFVLLVSFSPVQMPDNVPTTLSKAEMLKLVDNALKDSLFTSVTNADVKRLLGKINTSKSISKEKWDELAKKKHLSPRENESIFSFLGFINLEDFTNYANLLTSLGKKYGIEKMTKNDQKRFFDDLRKKQDDYISNNRLLEKVFKKTYPGSMPPECWKCVYDYRDCLSGGNWAVSYTPMTTTTGIYDFSNGGISITIIHYTTPSRAEITYVNQDYSTATCEGIYRNCINSCATP